MSDELVKKADQPIDNFDGYEDATEGEEEQSGSLLVGERVKFTNNAMWMVGDDELPEGLELILIDVLRVLVKWGRDQKPIKDATHILAAGEKWPDIEALNNKCPQNEWREGPDGKMQGPYQAQRVVYLLDPKTMTRYTWPTATTGGRIAISDVMDKVKWMRRFRGEQVYPVVTLADTLMKTKWGDRQRPHFNIMRWVSFGPGGEVKQLESATKTVTPPSAKEVTSDEIRF